MNEIKTTADRFKISVKRNKWLRALPTAALLIFTAGAVTGCGGGTTAESSNITETTTLPTTEAAAAETRTTAVTTTATTTVQLYTTTTFAEPDAEDMSVDPQLGAIALEMCKKDEEMLPLLYGCADIDQDDYIEVAVYDPSRRQDTTENRRYARVNDSHFSTWDDMVRYFRTLYTADCERIQNFTDATTREDAVWDDVKIGDFIEVKKAHVYIEYGGKLYRVSEIPKGFLFSTFDENDPVIITERTDTSFTAFIPRWDSTVALDPDFPKTIDTTSCNELRFILDPEYNDWRIDNIVYHDQGVYKKLFDKLNS